MMQNTQKGNAMIHECTATGVSNGLALILNAFCRVNILDGTFRYH